MQRQQGGGNHSKRKTAEYSDSPAMHTANLLIFKIDHDRGGSHPEGAI